MYFEHKIYKLLNEEDVMDKMIKFKDADGNEKEATVGGILKKGADHPAHDLAQKELDNAKGDGEDQPKSGPSIDVNPFDDKEKEAPKKPATTHTDKKFKKKAVPIMNDILDDVIDNYDGNFDQWMETGATQLPGDIDDALGELEAMSNADEVNKFKEKAYARIKNYVTDQGYDQGVGDEPSAASSDDKPQHDGEQIANDMEKMSELPQGTNNLYDRSDAFGLPAASNINNTAKKYASDVDARNLRDSVFDGKLSKDQATEIHQFLMGGPKPSDENIQSAIDLGIMSSAEPEQRDEPDVQSDKADAKYDNPMDCLLYTSPSPRDS